MRAGLGIAALLVALSGCIIVPIPIPVVSTTGPAKAITGGQVDSFGAALNVERARVGLPPLSVNPALTAAATAHARDMAQRGYFSHSSPDGRRSADRIRAAGYGACATAENIAMGYDTETQALAAWMASPGHRRNNLSRSVNEYGIGRSGDIWVLNFGRRC